MKPKKQTIEQHTESTLDRFKVRTGKFQREREAQCLMLGLALAEYFQGNRFSETFEEFNKKHLSQEDADKLHAMAEDANTEMQESIEDLLDQVGRTRVEARELCMATRGALMAIGAWEFVINFYSQKFPKTNEHD